jgi:hypothetical protein
MRCSFFVAQVGKAGRALILLGNPARDTGRSKCWKSQYFGRLGHSSPSAQWPISMATGNAHASHNIRPSTNTIRAPHPSASHGERNSGAGSPVFGRQFDVN